MTKAKTQEPKAAAKAGQEAMEWYETLVFAIVIVVLLFSFFFRSILVDGGSMNPTLSNGDRLVVWGAGYTPKVGDVIVIDGYISYGKPLVKRIIAEGGDTVDIDFTAGTVSVNGTVLDEPYVAAPTFLSEDVTFPLTIPDGTLFVMGDNRNNSRDSRSTLVGCIDKRDVLGKVILRMYPFTEFGGVK